MFEAFAKTIYELRKEKGLTQKQLSEMVGCSSAAIGWYERGEKIPTLETASKIADALDVSIDKLAGREPEIPMFDKWGDVIRMLCKMIVAIPNIKFEVEDKVYYQPLSEDESNQEDMAWLSATSIKEIAGLNPYAVSMSQEFRLLFPHKKPYTEIESQFPERAGEMIVQLLPLLQHKSLKEETFLSVMNDMAKKYDNESVQAVK